MHNHKLPARSTDSTFPLDVTHALKNLIEDSILAEYVSGLERWWDEREGGHIYMPGDVDLIRELLVKLWGEVLTSDAIDDAFGRLTEDGAKEWPRACCEEDEEDASVADLALD